MTRFRSRRCAALVLATGLIAACGGSEKNPDTDAGSSDAGVAPDGGNPPGSPTAVSGTMSAATTWTRDKLYVVTGCVNVQAALTIQAGTIVKFKPNACLQTSGSGFIDAGDSSDVAPIVFTSYKDDAHGGDTNQDGASSSAAAGDWGGIQLSANGSSFNRVQVLYAGGGDKPALKIGSSYSATVKNSLFSQNRPATEAITSAPALDASDAASATVIAGNTFVGNTVPLSVNTTFTLDDSNSFSGEPLNKFQAVVVRGCGHVASAITWSVTKVPLVIGTPSGACNYLTVDSGGTLVLADNTTLKFFKGGNIAVSGTLTANAATQIVFTSYRDDDHGGDTNADGPSAAAGGDWNGIRIGASGSSFDKCSFFFGGGLADGQSKSALSVASGKSISITSSVFAHTRTAQDAIQAPAALDLSEVSSGTVVTGNRFFDNTVPLAINAALSLDDSNLFDSGVAGSLLPNKYPGIAVKGCGSVASTTTWQSTKVPFVVGSPSGACIYLSVANGGHLIVGAGVTMKFFLNGSIAVAAGGILDFGAGAYLTSVKDDYLGIDTNGDGAATSPASGDWRGVKYAHPSGGPTCEASCVHYNTAGCSW